MKIRFQIEGIPALYKLMNKKKKLDFDFQGQTLQDFVNTLVRKFGPGVGKIILDDKNEIDMEYRVVINMSRFLSYGERMNETLKDGDLLHIMTVG